MPVCDQCGNEDVSHDCSYCDGTFCSRHRIPESHECSGLKNRQIAAELEAAASEGAVIGRIEEEDDEEDVDLSCPEPDVSTSPDTKLDGSIEKSEQPERIERDQPGKPGTIERIKTTLLVQWNRGGAVSRTLVRALGIVMVLIGAYNFLVYPFVGGEQILTQYYSFLPLFLSEVALMAIGASITWFL